MPGWGETTSPRAAGGFGGRPGGKSWVGRGGDRVDPSVSRCLDVAWSKMSGGGEGSAWTRTIFVKDLGSRTVRTPVGCFGFYFHANVLGGLVVWWWLVGWSSNCWLREWQVRWRWKEGQMEIRAAKDAWGLHYETNCWIHRIFNTRHVRFLQIAIRESQQSFSTLADWEAGWIQES